MPVAVSLRWLWAGLIAQTAGSQLASVQMADAWSTTIHAASEVAIDQVPPRSREEKLVEQNKVNIYHIELSIDGTPSDPLIFVFDGPREAGAIEAYRNICIARRFHKGRGKGWPEVIRAKILNDMAVRLLAPLARASSPKLREGVNDAGGWALRQVFGDGADGGSGGGGGGGGGGGSEWGEEAGGDVTGKAVLASFEDFEAGYRPLCDELTARAEQLRPGSMSKIGPWQAGAEAYRKWLVVTLIGVNESASRVNGAVTAALLAALRAVHEVAPAISEEALQAAKVAGQVAAGARRGRGDWMVYLVGFDAGHTAAMVLETFSLASVIAFDSCTQPYAEANFNFLHDRPTGRGRISLTCGATIETLVEGAVIGTYVVSGSTLDSW